MTRLELDEVFACPHLHGRISRRSCAARHKSFASKKHKAKHFEGISVLCAAGVAYELGWRAAGWLVGKRGNGGGAELMGDGEDDPLEDERG